jgi:gamma-glutamylputrescine oxidase
LRLSFPPAPSYYAASRGPAISPLRPPLQGAHQTSVAVVGGGIAGLSAALHLAKRGYRVTLLEARVVGYGASGRSGGQTIFGLAASQQVLKAQVGAELAHRLFDLSIEALQCTQRLIAAYGIECDYRANHIHVATKPRHVTELQAWLQELHEEYGYRSTSFLDRASLQSHVRSERYLGGLLDTGSGHLHPLKYTAGLAAAAEQEGVAIFENTQVLDYTVNGHEVIVRTAQGSVQCEHLVLCGNVYIGRVAPPLARRILGVGTYIVATEPLPIEQARSVLPSNPAIADMNWILDYFRLSQDNRLLFGGRVSYSALEPRRLAAAMKRRIVGIFPSLAAVNIDYAWGGYLDITMSRAPDFGRLEPNVYYMQGFSGHGMSLTGLAGQLVAEAIAGTAERFDVFAKIPHRDFPGGALLRRPSLVLAMLYYRLRDLL